ncbi:peptide-methionine (S)-S-oxide reductase [Gramella sp. AN32]|uniref:peptide-methionine (S)-S-oxide reductase n=1 Tax=Christiangramia antarctica TaxID=2058158 RepID=A0ABW5WZ07_9FLAO|nr:peptide-methionine (S)-S-oxide reductase [Gramella sp. AN32]MCM4156837.1 peptide methionine sulfoxide reductase [Gramella sp. AN32]
MALKKIGLGGGCHWCTEAVFQSLKGVFKVQQGYINASENLDFSEAILLEFDPSEISLLDLINVHLKTHESFSDHSMRVKYRSAIYVFSSYQKMEVQNILDKIQLAYEKRIITQVYQFHEFKESRAEIQNYYLQDPAKPFCRRYIAPKLKLLKKEFVSLLK